MNQSNSHGYLTVFIFLIYILPSIAVSFLIINFWFCFFFQCLGYQSLFLFLSTIFLGITICFWFSFSTVKIIDYLSSQPKKEEITLTPISKRKQISLYVIDFFIASFFYNILTRVYLLLHPERIPLKGDEIFGGYFVVGLVYFVASTYFFGKTLGNLITNSSFVSSIGGKPTLRQIVKRTLTLFVPYNFISIFGAHIPYHDYFSKTLVVENKDAQTPRKNPNIQLT